MKTRLYLVLSILSIVVSAFVTAGIMSSLPAQSSCVQTSRVSVNAGVTGLNIREQPITGKVLGSVTAGQVFTVLAVDASSCWYRVRTTTGVEGWISNGTQYVTVLNTATVTRTPSATRTATQGSTPTQIQTNTPLPPAVRTQTASQYAIRVCFFEHNENTGICSLLPFDTRVEVDVIQIQP